MHNIFKVHRKYLLRGRKHTVCQLRDSSDAMHKVKRCESAWCIRQVDKDSKNCLKSPMLSPQQALALNP